MGLTLTFFIFFLVWWILLFVVLPLRIDHEFLKETGHDAGAPKNAHIKYKLKLNTLISVAVTAVIWVFFYFYGADLQEYYIGVSQIY